MTRKIDTGSPLLWLLQAPVLALALLGLRSPGELARLHPATRAADVASAAAVGLAVLLALPAGVWALQLWLQGSAYAEHAGMLALAGMALAVVLHRQFGRAVELSCGLRRLLLRVLAASPLVLVAVIGAARLPPLFFAPQLAQHHESMVQAAQAEDREQRQAQRAFEQAQQTERQAQAALQQWERKLQAPQMRLQVLSQTSQRCQEQLQQVQASVPEDTEDPQHPYRLALVQAKANACAEAEQRLEQAQLLHESAGAQRLQASREQHLAANAAVKKAGQQLSKVRARIQERRAREQPPCERGSIQTCELSQAIASAHLAAWEVWAASLGVLTLITLPVLSRELLAPDTAARERRLLAMAQDQAERHIGRISRGGRSDQQVPLTETAAQQQT